MCAACLQTLLKRWFVRGQRGRTWLKHQCAAMQRKLRAYSEQIDEGRLGGAVDNEFFAQLTAACELCSEIAELVETREPLVAARLYRQVARMARAKEDAVCRVRWWHLMSLAHGRNAGGSTCVHGDLLPRSRCVVLLRLFLWTLEGPTHESHHACRVLRERSMHDPASAPPRPPRLPVRACRSAFTFARRVPLCIPVCTPHATY